MQSSRRCGPHHRAPEHRGGNSIRMSNSGYTSAFSRHGFARGLRFVVPRKEGAGNAGCALHPRSRVQKVEENAHEHTGQRRRSDIPCAMALRLITRSPRRIGLCCLRRPTESGTRPGRAFAPPQDLTPTTEASGPHDFTVRFSIVRPARRRPLTETRPANKLHARHRRVHHIPSQRSVTMANAPSSGTGWRES